LNTKNATRNVADANSGTDVVSTENVETARSVPEPSRMPAITPRKSEIGIMIAKTISARRPVLARRGQSSSETGVLKRMDSPKSPRTALVTHSL